MLLVKPSDDFKRAHLVMMLYNCILAELCFFVLFFGYDPTPGQVRRPALHPLPLIRAQD